MARRRVKATMIDVVATPAGLVARRPEPIGPTAERLARGDLRRVTVYDEGGVASITQRSYSLVERLAIAGELGDDVARLLFAAEWFTIQGESARLRGRMVRSQLSDQLSDVTTADEMLRARAALAHGFDAIGADGFNVLYDALVWNLEPRGADRRALLRAALYGLARWLRVA